MPNAWMIRCGISSVYADRFEKGFVAIGCGAADLGDPTKITTREEFESRYRKARPQTKDGVVYADVGMLFRFCRVIQVGDWVVTYYRATREYRVGKIKSDCYFDPKFEQSDPGIAYVRKVAWEKRVSRDALKTATKNTLGGIQTLFLLNEDALNDLLQLPSAPANETPKNAETEKVALQELKEDITEKAHELIEDKILQLSDSELPELVAAILRAMGLKTRVSPPGPDRGVDVWASPDGLGFVEPRIKTEVKHRPNEIIGAQTLRSFIGALRSGDKGLYVSTGGFTKDAKYEAERATVPLTLIDLDELAQLVTEHYAKFDTEGQTLLPLVRIYWPSE
jgi:restriction system protein